MNRNYMTPLRKSLSPRSLLKPIIIVSSESCVNFSSVASIPSPSSSLQTLTESESKPISNPLYTFLPHTQNPNNIVNLICSSLKQEIPNLALLHKGIKGILPCLGAQEISRVLLRCQSNSSKALTFFDWVKNDLCVQPNPHNYCLIVHILVWSGKYKQAMKLLTELIELNICNSQNVDVFQNLISCTEVCSWDPVIFDMLVKGYVKAGLVLESFCAFKRMTKLGFVPSVVTTNCLLNTLLKSKDPDKCWEIYEEMEKIGVHPNLYTFNILTNVICKRGDVKKVKEFLEKMEEEGFDPDVVTYNTLIGSYCKRGSLKEAVYLYNIMFKRRIFPDLFSYTALINGFCKAKNMKEAQELFNAMIHRGLNPDIVLYNTLINGYSKEGMMQEARCLLHHMIDNRVQPDRITCLIVVDGYAKQDRLLSGINLVVELKKFGVLIHRDVYNYLILALCKQNHPFAAKNLFKMMSQDGYKPNLELYNSLIDSLCRSNCIDEAILIKNDMVRDDKMKPNLVTFRAIIGCLCRLSRSDYAETLLREIVEFAGLPDTAICRDLVTGLCNERNISKAELVLKYFVDEFKIFDTECYNAILRVYSEEGDVRKLMEVHDKMVKTGFAPNINTVKYVMDGMQIAAGVDKDKHRVC